jgi:hypothetical protein
MSVFLTRRFFLLLTLLILGLAVAFFLPWLLGLMRVVLGLLAVLALHSRSTSPLPGLRRLMHGSSGEE